MKYLVLIPFLILIGCKGEPNHEPKTENGIDKSVYEMWSSFVKSNPDFEDAKMPEAWYFHDNEKDANRLAELVVNGKKQAGSGLYAWYAEANADLPKVGTKHIITDFDGKAKAIIEVKKVDTIPFNHISTTYAQMDMGTDIDPLKKWKKAHWDFFVGTMDPNEVQPTEEMLVVCERFEKIWPE